MSVVPDRQCIKLVEKEIKGILESTFKKEYPFLGSILAYHFGWGDKNAGSGKKIRPRLLLLTCATLGGDWEKAIDAGIAIELIHNFSIVHDDIQDQSELRHGRKSTWKKYGIAQAINTGDALLVCAFQAAGRLKKN